MAEHGPSEAREFTITLTEGTAERLFQWAGARPWGEQESLEVYEKLGTALRQCDCGDGHEWMDARNAVVESGEVCLRCGAIRPSPSVESSSPDREGESHGS